MKRDIFQGLADPSRRAILVFLTAGAMTPNALAEHFQFSRQAVSKHIRYLAECDLVEPQKMGREIYYGIKAAKLKEVDQWLRQFKELWEKRFSQLDDLLAGMKKKSQTQEV